MIVHQVASEEILSRAEIAARVGTTVILLAAAVGVLLMLSKLVRRS